MASKKSVLGPIEETKGPASTVAADVLAFCTKYYDQTLLTGETFAFPKLRDGYEGLRFVEGKVVPIPGYEEREQDETTYGSMGELDTKMEITIHADTAKYKKGDATSNELLGVNLKKWIINDLTNYGKILNYEITSSSTATHVVLVTFLCEHYMFHEVIGDIIDSPFMEEVWNKHINSVITEGVVYAHGKVPVKLRDSLRKNIDDVAKNTPVDYHPNSNDIVRDLVHPALYPYVKDVSKTVGELPDPVGENEKFDYWGRPYEDSKFQWLPAPYKISADGKCSIMEYINNLDRNRFPALYKDLEQLFEIIVPYFEEVWAYAKAMNFFIGTKDDEDDENTEENFTKEKVDFKDRELQVITKIVEYGLDPV